MGIAPEVHLLVLAIAQTFTLYKHSKLPVLNGCV